jgi:hypothetical protein
MNLQTLLKKYGLTTTLGYNNNNFKQRIIVVNRKKEIEKFIENIRPYIISCLAYKIRSRGPSGLIRGKNVNNMQQ